MDISFSSEAAHENQNKEASPEEQTASIGHAARGKTTIRQLNGRRVVRFGEVKGKTIASLELFTSDGDSHAFTIRFQDRTALHLGISPGFTVHAEHYKNQGLYDPLVLKRWPAIKSE